MSYLKKSGIALVVAIACSMALPSSPAQTRETQMVLRVAGPDGAYLGVEMKDVTADNMSKYKLGGEKGVIVSSVIKGSPAETATLKADDVILEFGGFAVWSASQLTRLVQETPAGRKVDIAVSRDGKRISLNATLGKREERRAERRIETSPEDWFGFGPGQQPFQFRAPDMPERSADNRAPQKARLGVTVQPLTDQLGEFLGVPGKTGVLVTSVMDGSPSTGKLKSGDVIVSVDGKAADSPEELTRQIRAASEGAVNLKIIRDKKEIPVVITLPASDEKGYKL